MIVCFAEAAAGFAAVTLEPDAHTPQHNQQNSCSNQTAFQAMTSENSVAKPPVAF